jgi:hypothetical protein
MSFWSRRVQAIKAPSRNTEAIIVGLSVRLDIRSSAFAQADSGGHAIVPGDVAASELIRRITSGDEDKRMPPEGEKCETNWMRC